MSEYHAVNGRGVQPTEKKVLLVHESKTRSERAGHGNRGRRVANQGVEVKSMTTNFSYTRTLELPS